MKSVSSRRHISIQSAPPGSECHTCVTWRLYTSPSLAPKCTSLPLSALIPSLACALPAVNASRWCVMWAGEHRRARTAHSSWSRAGFPLGADILVCIVRLSQCLEPCKESRELSTEQCHGFCEVRPPPVPVRRRSGRHLTMTCRGSSAARTVQFTLCVCVNTHTKKNSRAFFKPSHLLLPLLVNQIEKKNPLPMVERREAL